ncbi:hypothetical protein SBDP1_680020 [Syntrophobacter sp. SbD1]|nr:hypothetical protein SBDP1_680020 [Syntrophobacter sp. SbD1]
MMIADYFDCTICAGEADPKSVLPDCVLCKDAGCDACLDETGKCVPCA